jgi:hypothetical protein
MGFTSDTATMSSTMSDVVTMSIHFNNVNNQNLYIMNNVLSQAILIDIVEFSNLINPKLIDITDVDDDYNYFMLLESENKVYKVLMSVF